MTVLLLKNNQYEFKTKQLPVVFFCQRLNQENAVRVPLKVRNTSTESVKFVMYWFQKLLTKSSLYSSTFLIKACTKINEWPTSVQTIDKNRRPNMQVIVELVSFGIWTSLRTLRRNEKANKNWIGIDLDFKKLISETAYFKLLWLVSSFDVVNCCGCE